MQASWHSVAVLDSSLLMVIPSHTPGSLQIKVQSTSPVQDIVMEIHINKYRTNFIILPLTHPGHSSATTLVQVSIMLQKPSGRNVYQVHPGVAKNVILILCNVILL